MTHTELPWTVWIEDEPSDFGGAVASYVRGIRSEGGIICEFADDYGTSFSANAELIVRAVNSHADLLEACKAAAAIINRYECLAKTIVDDDDGTKVVGTVGEMLLGILNQAIRKGESNE